MNDPNHEGCITEKNYVSGKRVESIRWVLEFLLPTAKDQNRHTIYFKLEPIGLPDFTISGDKIFL